MDGIHRCALKTCIPAVCRFPFRCPKKLRQKCSNRLKLEIKAGAVWWLVGNLRVFGIEPIRWNMVEQSCAPRYSTGWWLWCFQCKQFWGEYRTVLVAFGGRCFLLKIEKVHQQLRSIEFSFDFGNRPWVSWWSEALVETRSTCSLWNHPLTWGPCLFSGGVDFCQNVSQSFQHCYVLTLSHWNLVNSKSLQMVKLLVGAHVSA